MVAQVGGFHLDFLEAVAVKKLPCQLTACTQVILILTVMSPQNMPDPYLRSEEQSRRGDDDQNGIHGASHQDRVDT